MGAQSYVGRDFQAESSTRGCNSSFSWFAERPLLSLYQSSGFFFLRTGNPTE